MKGPSLLLKLIAAAILVFSIFLASEHYSAFRMALGRPSSAFTHALQELMKEQKDLALLVRSIGSVLVNCRLEGVPLENFYDLASSLDSFFPARTGGKYLLEAEVLETERNSKDPLAVVVQFSAIDIKSKNKEAEFAITVPITEIRK